MTAGELTAQLARLEVSADIAQAERLLAWLVLLDRWNRTFNLTAISAVQRVAQLVLMSAAVIPHLKAGDVLDVGSGAGVPGVVLAILVPDNRYTLLDSNGKKTRFLEQCQAELALDNVRVVRERVERFEGAAFDTIAARAFSGLGMFFSATCHLARPGTRWLTFKGAAAADEVRHLPPDRTKCRLHSLHVPGVDRPASLVTIEAK